MIKLTLFANDSLANKATRAIMQAKEKYPWIDFSGSFANYFEYYGDGNHGFNNEELNTHGFRVVAVPIGQDNEYTDVATLFIASNFDKMPNDDIKYSQTIATIDVDKSNLTDGFLFLASLSDEDERKIIVRNFSQWKNKGFAKLTF